MATFQRFDEIEAWQKARELTRELYAVSSQGQLAKDFALRDQMCEAGVSVMSNIAEGFERSGTGEFVQFLAVAKGSAGEVRSHLYVALDQGYITRGQFDKLCALVRTEACTKR
jgi:four helix bundle protein